MASLPHMASLANSPHPASAIELRAVSQIFGSFVALRQLSLRIPAGASVVLLGENGAGKSTLLRLLAGFAAPSRGELRVFGRSPRDLRGRIAYMGHTSMLYDELTAMENLSYFARLGSAAGRAEVASTCGDALRSVGLDPANPRRVGEYSQGMRQRASLARVLMSRPDLLLLDEPFSNLDKASAQAIVASLQRFAQEPASRGGRRTLLLTTHQAELAQPLAELTITLARGELAGLERRETVLPGSWPGPGDLREVRT